MGLWQSSTFPSSFSAELFIMLLPPFRFMLDAVVNFAIKQPHKCKNKKLAKDLETLSNYLPQEGRINRVKIETLYRKHSLCGYFLTHP